MLPQRRRSHKNAVPSGSTSPFSILPPVDGAGWWQSHTSSERAPTATDLGAHRGGGRSGGSSSPRQGKVEGWRADGGGWDVARWRLAAQRRRLWHDAVEAGDTDGGGWQHGGGKRRRLGCGADGRGRDGGAARWRLGHGADGRGSSATPVVADQRAIPVAGRSYGATCERWMDKEEGLREMIRQ
jgi:hypothetical protein